MKKSQVFSGQLLKILGGFALVFVLVIGFMGYMTPGMRINWETIATMCGF